MTRKVTRKTHTLKVSAQLFGVVTLLIALAALAQTRGRGLPSGRPSVAPASPNASAAFLAQERPLLQGGSSVERAPLNYLHGRGLGARSPQAGNQLFVPAVSYDSGGQYAWSVAVGDVNGDGKSDLVVANDCADPDNCYNNASVGVLLGNGDGTFQPAVAYWSGGNEALSVAIADVNGDGRPDVLVANVSGPGVALGVLGVLLGNGDGTFQPPVIYDSGGLEAQSVAVADVNGDGRPDLLVAHLNDYNGTVGVLLGNGDGTFQPAVTYYGGDSSIAVADVNGDGKLDLVATLVCPFGVCDREGSVSVLMGNGDGTFQSAVSYDSGGKRPLSVAVADVNGDGKPDLLVANCGFDGCTTGSGVGVLLGNGDGTFQAAVIYGSGGIGAGSIAVADVSGDGKPDLLVANKYDSTLGVLLGNGDGTFQPAEIYNPGGVGPNALVAEDVDGNGTPDLLVANICDLNCTTSAGAVGVLLHVGTKVTTTKLSSSLNPSVFGQVVTFTAMVRSGFAKPTGTVAFFDGASTLGIATLVNGSTSFSVPALAVASHSITALYQGSGKYAPSTSDPVTQVVNSATTTASLASSQNPAVVTELVTYTATVASQYGGPATGTVMFQDGGATIATVTLAAGHAAYSTKYTTVGAHAITANYSGDANNIGSVSATLLEQINQGFSSKTVLTTSGSPSFVGQPVTFTATVSSSHGTIPDGELVTFYDGLTAIGTGTTAGGVATFSTSSLSAKTHTIKAKYPGDATFRPSTGSVTQVVEKYPTTTTLTSSPNPSQFGQAVTFTAHVTSTGPAPTGKVKFLDGTTSLGVTTLSGGVAKLTKSTLAVGTHPITAQYLGDAVSAKSTSSVVNQVVQ